MSRIHIMLSKMIMYLILIIQTVHIPFDSIKTRDDARQCIKVLYNLFFILVCLKSILAILLYVTLYILYVSTLYVIVYKKMIQYNIVIIYKSL